MNDTANQNDQNQTNVSPVNTSYGDGGPNPIPTAPVVEETPASAAPPVTSSIPAAAPTDVTSGNQPTISATPPPPGNGQTVTSFKPIRGKFTSTGIIATIFGILVLVGATIVGITQVGQVQIFKEKAASVDKCAYCAGTDQCPNPASTSDAARAVCGGLNCCQGWQPATGGGPACSNGGIPCGGITCNSGKTFGPDACYTGGSCSQRATTACANEGGVKGAATPTPSTTIGGGSPTCNNQNTLYCNHSSFAFNTCPDPICATDQKTCAQVAQDLGCYRTGGGACTTNADCTAANGGGTCQNGTCSGAASCSGNWILFKCPNQFSGNCNTGPTTQVSNSSSFVSPFCGSQQIDCSNNSGFFVGKVDRSGCTTAVTTPGPSPSSPPPGGGGPVAQCLNIKAYDTSWNQLTTQQLSALKAGDSVRFAVKGSATAGKFDKARFTINGVLRPEVTTTNPSDAQQFYDQYTIPGGVTNFNVGAEIHYVQLNTWN